MYAVIVCSKCRMHAQIIQMDDIRSVKCQRCGYKLQLSKLQFLTKSENHKEIILARTSIQAQLSGPLSHTKQFDIDHNSLFLNKNENKIIKNLPQEILKILSKEKEMSLDQLVSYCINLDFKKEKIYETVKILNESGDIYFPKIGMVKKI